MQSSQKSAMQPVCPANRQTLLHQERAGTLDKHTEQVAKESEWKSPTKRMMEKESSSFRNLQAFEWDWITKGHLCNIFISLTGEPTSTFVHRNQTKYLKVNCKAKMKVELIMEICTEWPCLPGCWRQFITETSWNSYLSTLFLLFWIFI